MKNVNFLKSSVMVIPVIKYIMDCISAMFVCWFQKVGFCSMFVSTALD